MENAAAEQVYYNRLVYMAFLDCELVYADTFHPIKRWRGIVAFKIP